MATGDWRAASHIGLACILACVVAGCGKRETKAAAENKPFLTVAIGKGITMEFVLIPAGTFMMGAKKGGDSEEPVHKVTITKPFYMGKYAVTQEQWEAVMGSNPSRFKGAKNPVEQVSWEDCGNFIGKLKEKVSDSSAVRS